jgi:hypothetical protein
LAIAGLSGCVRFKPKPLSASTGAADFESRTLADPSLRAFLETNRLAGE